MAQGWRWCGEEGEVMLTSDCTRTPTVLQRNLHPTFPFFSPESKTLLTWYLVTQVSEPPGALGSSGCVQGAPSSCP